MCFCYGTKIKNCLFRPSLDRINNNIKEHTKENSQLVCQFINFFRGNLSIKDFNVALNHRKITFKSKNAFINHGFSKLNDEEVFKFQEKLRKFQTAKRYINEAIEANAANNETFKPHWDRTKVIEKQAFSKVVNLSSEESDDLFLHDQRSFMLNHNHEEYFKRVCKYINEVPPSILKAQQLHSGVKRKRNEEKEIIEDDEDEDEDEDDSDNDDNDEDDNNDGENEVDENDSINDKDEDEEEDYSDDHKNDEDNNDDNDEEDEDNRIEEEE